MLKVHHDDGNHAFSSVDPVSNHDHELVDSNMYVASALWTRFAGNIHRLRRLGNAFKFKISAATCEQEFSGIGGIGNYWAQLFQKMSLSTGDMQAWCFYNWNSCDRPPVIQIDESKWFSPKPASAMVAPPPSGMSVGRFSKSLLIAIP